MSVLCEGRGLVRRYSGVTALRLDSFSVIRGGLVALTGRNGSGKSTLLRLLAMLEEPDEGSLSFHGIVRNDVAYLLQDPYLLRMSVRDNVLLGLRLRGVTEGLERRYRDAMEAVGFADPDAIGARMPSTLSGGERQRAALAARIILNPSMLLLDEPTANVDERSEAVILNTLRRCMDDGTAVVCATHDRDAFDTIGAVEFRLERHP